METLATELTGMYFTTRSGGQWSVSEIIGATPSGNFLCRDEDGTVYVIDEKDIDDHAPFYSTRARAEQEIAKNNAA
jgi:hypothetical protein